MAKIRFAGREFHLPASRAARLAIGAAFVLFGLVGFLPVVGYWMIPVGLLILSVDLPIVRRWRRALSLRWERWRRPDTAARRRQADDDPTRR